MSNFIFKTMTALVLGIVLWAILLVAAATAAKGQIDACQQGCLDELHACEAAQPWSYNHCRKQYFNCLKRLCGITVAHR